MEEWWVECQSAHGFASWSLRVLWSPDHLKFVFFLLLFPDSPNQLDVGLQAGYQGCSESRNPNPGVPKSCSLDS